MCEKYLQGVYVVFDNNDVFLADFVTALDYNDVYPKLFCYEGVSAEQWRSIIHGSGAGDIIIPSMTLSSKYIGENIPTVTYVVRSVAEQLVRNQSAICFILNEELLMRSFVSNEQYEQGCIELTDQTGKLLSRHGDVRDEDGVRLTRYSSDGSLSVSVIVPYSVIYHQVNMITGMIMKYVYIGLFGLLFLVGAVVVMYYKRAYRIVRVSRRGSIELKQTKKQHDFVDDAIRSIIQSRDEAERRLVLLQNTWDTELLWDVCVRGIMTAAEGRNVDRLLEGISEQYVVVLIADREESENRKLIVWLEEFMRVFCPTGVSLFPNGVSMAFIAPLSRQADYDCLLEHVKRLDGA